MKWLILYTILKKISKLKDDKSLINGVNNI